LEENPQISSIPLLATITTQPGERPPPQRCWWLGMAAIFLTRDELPGYGLEAVDDASIAVLMSAISPASCQVIKTMLILGKSRRGF
jgi:hypothetical protein